MQENDEICLCFHVKLRALRKFIRLEQPSRASQLSECYGAGTGCGWCRPYLEAIFADAQAKTPNASDPNPSQLSQLTPENYAQARKEYRDEIRNRKN